MPSVQVVVQDAGEDVREQLDVLEDAVADLGVLLDEAELFVGEAAGFAQD